MDAGMVDDKVVDMMADMLDGMVVDMKVDMVDVDDMDYNSIVLRNKN